ncbi:MAG: hypothetical protein IPM69_17085 [Ignavibacteria bacterium]|nr:hypothetical protein [Ignavibacteria bacterium]
MLKHSLTHFLLSLACISLLTGCISSGIKQTVSLQTITPVILKKNGNEIFHYWQLPNKPSLWGTKLGTVPELELFRDSLKNILGNERFTEMLHRQSSQDVPEDTAAAHNGDAYNSNRIHTGKSGTIRAINFLEAALLNYQLSRYPFLSHPTEFHGFIVFNQSKDSVRVYFAASDQPWPPKATILLQSIADDIQHGWKLAYHLHNHYEPKAKNYLGILAPSMADAQFYTFLQAEYGLRKALITNGFHTVEIDSSEFLKFKAHGH